MSNPDSVTELLLAYRDGDRKAFDRLAPLLVDDLRKIAHWQLRRGRSSPMMGTTVLVHEIYLKMADQTKLDARDRGHFLAISAHAMRRVMADHARRRPAAKRGGDSESLPLDGAPELADAEARRLLDVDRALERLSTHSERMARIVECRFFAGYTDEETAEVLAVSLRTVQRDWMKARAWLREELDDFEDRSDL